MNYRIARRSVDRYRTAGRTDDDKIIAMMVGRSLNQRFPDKETSRAK